MGSWWCEGIFCCSHSFSILVWAFNHWMVCWHSNYRGSFLHGTSRWELHAIDRKRNYLYSSLQIVRWGCWVQWKSNSSFVLNLFFFLALPPSFYIHTSPYSKIFIRIVPEPSLSIVILISFLSSIIIPTFQPSFCWWNVRENLLNSVFIHYWSDAIFLKIFIQGVDIDFIC